jgi:D-3-phosphoglycerate dehydrogenase
VPGRNAVAVAELTLGLILAVDRRIADNVADARRGRWEKATYSKADGLLGSTLGILGLGSIGLAVAERATGFGMRVAPRAPAGPQPATRDRLAELNVVGFDALPALLAAADVVSLHVPSSRRPRTSWTPTSWPR